MTSTKQWLAQLEKYKQKIACPVDLNTYFELPEIAGRKLEVIDIGECDLPSGKVLVYDPFSSFIKKEAPSFFLTAHCGTYRTEVCVVKPEEIYECARYAAVRLCFSEKRPVCFYGALTEEEQTDTLEKDTVFFGFGVDCGMACIIDKEVHFAFCDWLEKWEKEHPGANKVEDYFAPLLEESYKMHPQFQRSFGDWLNWKIPDTQYHVPIFTSGFGDGYYPVYWGFDENGEICQLVVHFIDIALNYEEEQE